MPKLTTAQRRAAQLENFNNNYIHDIETARKIFNSYYRYVALQQRVFLLKNDSRTYNTPYRKAEAAKEAKHYKRLCEYLKPYGIIIFVPWTLPFLGIKDPENGAIKEQVIEPILY